MIQDLGEKRLYNQFEDRKIEEADKVFCFNGDKILVIHDEKQNASAAVLPSAGGIPGLLRDESKSQYLFRISGTRYFLAETPKTLPEGFVWEQIRALRRPEIKEVAFAAATAYHLYQWYRDNRFCGRCGKRLCHDHKERMLRCEACGNTVYPKIAPAIILAITKGDEILLTKYSGRVYKKYALIAGFTEIGETAEETAVREAMEEVGLKIKNLTYYKSQPWGVDSNLLMGFFCEVDGDDEITMDAEELAVAEWVHRTDMPEPDEDFSLTGEMMAAFKRGER